MITGYDQQWELVGAHADVHRRTLARFRMGLPIRRSSLARIARAAEALGLQHLLRHEPGNPASAQ